MSTHDYNVTACLGGFRLPFLWCGNTWEGSYSFEEPTLTKPRPLALRVLALLTTLTFTVPALADGRPVPESDWDEATKLTLAQIMVGEADWHEPDHVAIAYVLARRWPQFQQGHGPISFSRYISMYSSVMKVDSKRTRWVRGLPWGEITGPYAKRWNRVVQLVQAWGEGKVKDPCPDAAHWGGAMDRPGKTWEPVSCGLTKNIFYTKRDRRVASR